MQTSTSTSSRRLTLCGSLSLHPVSLGAAMHMAGYAALDLPFCYVPFGVTDLDGAIRGMRALSIRGLGISMPYKRAVLPLCDRLDDTARSIGAANTVVNDAGQLTAFNTDVLGALGALDERVGRIAGKRVLLLGAGGAAAAIAHGVAGAGAHLRIANRDLDRGRALARAAGGDAVPFEDGVAESAEHEVIINATSVGMIEVDAQSPIPEHAIQPSQVVMDIVYKPVETELVRAARRRGATAIDGSRMLLFQAMRQFELYTGQAAPRQAMEGALMAQLRAS